MITTRKLNLFASYNVISRISCIKYENFSTTRKEKVPIPKNILKDLHSANDQTTNGEIYDKKPFKLELEAGKKYSWCLCGKSRNQPFCDGTHKDIFLKIKHRPIRFEVEETKNYWLCNCKQTTNRPFCDGTHKRQDIQEANIKL